MKKLVKHTTYYMIYRLLYHKMRETAQASLRQAR